MLRPTRTTPDRLLLATVSVILAGLISGGLGVLGFTGRAQALDQARAETAHQARLQIILTRSVIADTAAGDDVLRGTEQKPIAARAFGYALQPAVTGLAIAAAQGADASRLAVANLWLARYAQQIENARTLARAGDKAAAARSLQGASALLRAHVLPEVTAVQKASQARLAGDRSAATRGTLIALLGALLAVIALAGVHWWLALLTRRIVNVGLATGLVLLLAVGLIGLVAVTVSTHRANAAQNGPQVVAQRVVESRVGAFDARGQESLSVIGDEVLAAEPGWRVAMGTARAALTQAAQTSADAGVRSDLTGTLHVLDVYAKAHAALLTVAMAGNSEQLRALSASADGPAGAFEDFDATSGALLARQVQVTDDGWAQAGRYLFGIGWLSLVTGIAAAGSGWSGLAARSREYR